MKNLCLRFQSMLSCILMVCLIMGCHSDSKNAPIEKIPRSQRAGLMVLNFKNSTLENRAKEFQPWEFGIASMIMTDLESIGLFNIVSMERLNDILDQQALQQLGVLDDQEVVKIGKIAAAKYLLTGSFMELNGYLRIEAQVLSVERGVQLGAAEITGPTNTFFQMEKELVIKLLSYMEVALNKQEEDLISRNIETRSIEASLSNYAGELAVIQADKYKKMGESSEAKFLIKEAKKNFKKALRYDPNYAKAKQNLLKLAKAIPMTL